jgi:hypothetical protein
VLVAAPLMVIVFFLLGRSVRSFRFCAAALFAVRIKSSQPPSPGGPVASLADEELQDVLRRQ